jgi:enoyl-CoA hydratase/carnithine racemase
MSDNEHPPIDISVDGPVTTISMVYEPYNLVGPTLLNPLLAAIESAAANGARAIVVRSGLRHFSAGADLALSMAAVRVSPPARTQHLTATSATPRR